MQALLIFLGCFFITYFTIPKIIGVVEFKNLADKPNKRSSHTKVTPTLGGIAFYFTLMIAFCFSSDYDFDKVVYNIIPGLTILLFFGLKDDLVVLSPYTKLLGQIAAAGFLVLNDSLKIETLSGFLGIYEIPIYLSVLFSILLVVTIINAYNLIDGIDGLAAGIGIVISVVNMIIYYYLDVDFYFYLSLSVTAILLAFLRFNLSEDKKIFMGDTGSLIIGFVISIYTLKLLTLKNNILASDLPFNLENLPLVAIVILIVPLFDVARVFTIRLINKKSPFSADRNHIHHILVDLGFSHVKSSMILALTNLVFVAFFIYLSFKSKQGYLIFFLFVFLTLGFYLFYLLDYSFSNLRKKVSFRNRKKKIKDKILDASKKKNKSLQKDKKVL